MRLLALAVLLSVPLATAPCAAQPKVDCPITLHDYGVRLPGPLPTAEFLVANRGQDPLTLTPKLCCGLQLEGVEKPIAPGETRRLIASPTHPLGDGGMRKSMRLLTNDPDLPELVLELMAMGKSPLQVLPGDELTVSLLAEEVPPQTVLLRVNYELELKLTSIRCSAPYVHCKEVKPDVPEGDAPATCRAIEISVSPNAPSTPYDAVIAIGTTCKARPEVKVHVYGLSPSAVTAQPPRLDFDPLDKNEDTVTRVVVLTRAVGPFKVLDVKTTDPRMQVKLQSDPSGLFSELVATFHTNEERGAFHGTITIKTDDPERPKLVIPYTGEAH